MSEAPRAFRYILYVAVGAVLVLFQAQIVPRACSSSTPQESIAQNALMTDWRVLRELDLSTGKKSEKLEALHDKVIKIPGFMVPFEDNQGQASEFLLVPSPQACIHVPPPPPNQMIYVKMTPPQKAPVSSSPIWVIGTFHIQNNDSPYGKVSFFMSADFTKPFRAGAIP